MTAPREILDLVENFDQHVEDYRKGSLNETQLRVSFLNPFLKALGWDETTPRATPRPTARRSTRIR